jgi:hypothetical protein
MIIGVNHNPQPVESENRRQQVYCSEIPKRLGFVHIPSGETSELRQKLDRPGGPVLQVDGLEMKFGEDGGETAACAVAHQDGGDHVAVVVGYLQVAGAR